MTKLYHSAGWQTIQEVEYTGSYVGTVLLLNSPQDNYSENVWSLAYVDAMVMQDRWAGAELRSEGARTYVLQDSGFNVTTLLEKVDGTFEAARRYVYDPYGRVDAVLYGLTWEIIPAMAQNALSTWRYLHKGGYYTPDSLYHFRHRSYDSYAGKWMQRDPAGYIDGLNLYEYVGGNPVNNVDPSGQFFISVPLLIAFGVGSLLAGGATVYYTGTNGGQSDWSHENVDWTAAGTNALIGGMAASFAFAAAAGSITLMGGGSTGMFGSGAFAMYAEGAIVNTIAGGIGFSTYAMTSDALTQDAYTGSINWAQTYSAGNDAAPYGMAFGFGAYNVSLASSALWGRYYGRGMPGMGSRGGAFPDELIGTHTKVRITADKTTALLPSKGGTGPLRWQVKSRTSPVWSGHGNSLLSPRTAYLYRLYTNSGDFLKVGMSQDPYSRYTQGFLWNKYIRVFAQGSRAEMSALERYLVETEPGPLNFEPWVGGAR